MASKSDKGKKPSGKTNAASGKEHLKKESSKPKKQMEEDDDDDDLNDEEAETSAVSKKKPAISSKKSKKDDDDDDVEDVVDDWNKVEEEEEWDPDFEEFDLPKSKGKKTGSGGGKKGLEEEDEFKFDDEFKDMGLFNENNYDDEEDDF